MRSRIERFSKAVPTDQLLSVIEEMNDVVLLHSSLLDHRDARYSYLAAFPLMTFRSFGPNCHVRYPVTGATHTYYGNPWMVLEQLMHPFEILEELDSPFPLGGCFGYWGYDLKQFVEPRLTRQAIRRSNVPDAYLGLYASLLVIDHVEDQTWIIATGFRADGSRSSQEADLQCDHWKGLLNQAWQEKPCDLEHSKSRHALTWSSYPDREHYLDNVKRAQDWISQGDIYQVNLSRELSLQYDKHPIECYRQLQEMSPAPFAGYIQAGDFQILSASPEAFLKIDGTHMQTRPIKGTRPRGRDAQLDAQLAYELQSSEKERAELLMITDLLRNDLGRISEYGTVTVPDLMCLERYPHVHHLVSTVEGQLRKEHSHLKALSSCFPGGSITGAPKIRAMEIIEQLEPVTRGPYTGSMGYLGFNKTSRLNILIRTAVMQQNRLSLHVGAGIVADSDPAYEFQETEDKAAGFFAAFAAPDSFSSNDRRSIDLQRKHDS